jgi:hypothetical protein
MKSPITESLVLLHGPYKAPRCRVGGVLTCELRDRDVVVGGMSDGLIPWPTVKMKGRRSLILCGDLVRAVRCESRLAVAHHWGVSVFVVTKWRRTLGVERLNEGSLRIARIAVAGARVASKKPKALAKLRASKRGKPAHPNTRAALLRTAQAPRVEKWRRALSRRRKKQFREGTLKGLPNLRFFTPEEIALLGTDTDRAVASALGRDVQTISWKRRKLRIPAVGRKRAPGVPHLRPFTPREIAFLGTDTDRAIAKRLRRNAGTVEQKRRALGIPSFSAGRPSQPFTPEEIALLGSDTDEAVAQALGRHVRTVGYRRRKLGIPPFGK